MGRFPSRDEAAEKLLAHLLGSSTVEVPEVLIADELDHLIADLWARVKVQGLSWEQFLLQARKTEDEIRADWRDTAERRAKSLLVLDALATREVPEGRFEPLARTDFYFLQSFFRRRDAVNDIFFLRR